MADFIFSPLSSNGLKRLEDCASTQIKHVCKEGHYQICLQTQMTFKYLLTKMTLKTMFTNKEDILKVYKQKLHWKKLTKTIFKTMFTSKDNISKQGLQRWHLQKCFQAKMTFQNKVYKDDI